MSKKRNTSLLSLVLLGFVLYVAYTQFTLFVILPIEDRSAGETLVINRLEGHHFVESADAICNRTRHEVSLLCRGEVVAEIRKSARIFLTLPFSERLYLWSTEGKRYNF